jgi:hypothetical protein
MRYEPLSFLSQQVTYVVLLNINISRKKKGKKTQETMAGSLKPREGTGQMYQIVMILKIMTDDIQTCCNIEDLQHSSKLGFGHRVNTSP